MANFDMSVTADGIKLLAATLAGETLTFTNIKMGAGTYQGLVSVATDLVDAKVTLPVEKISRKDREATAKSTLMFKTVETGFNWTELGLFAKNPAGGNDILYAYGYAGSEGEYVPGKNDTTLNEKVIRFTVVVSEAINITVDTTSEIYVGMEAFEAVAKGMVVTLTHTKEGTVHVFTGLEGRTGLVPCQFKSTAGYTDGDTATIDGTAYTITLTSADAPETDLFVSGKSIIVDVDTESKTINFKAGGGLTKAKLALANATEDTVFNGRTFYAGSKVLRTGRALATATNVTAAKMFAGTTAYNQQGQLITGNPAATNVTAVKMFTGTTAFDRYGNLITGAPTATTAAASDIAKGKTAYTNAGTLLTGTGRTLLAGSIGPPIEYKTYTISYPSGITSKPKAIVAYFNVWVGDYATSGQQPSFSPYFYRGAVSGQLNGITTAVSGKMRNQNQSSANTEINVGTTSFSVTFSKHDYVSGSEFCYICIW